MSALDNALRDALAELPHDDVVQHVKVLLDELEAEHGTVPEVIREQTRRMWPNYEEGW